MCRLAVLRALTTPRHRTLPRNARLTSAPLFSAHYITVSPLMSSSPFTVRPHAPTLPFPPLSLLKLVVPLPPPPPPSRHLVQRLRIHVVPCAAVHVIREATAQHHQVMANHLEGGRRREGEKEEKRRGRRWKGSQLSCWLWVGSANIQICRSNWLLADQTSMMMPSVAAASRADK